jgi:predicted phosphoribosyltransferase
MFKDRTEAALRLAQLLKTRQLENPLVLGIPRGGVVIAAELARALGAEFDIVLSRKLRAPYQPELAIGAIGEDGEQYLNEYAWGVTGVTEEYIAQERAHQLAEIRRRAKLFREARPAAEVAQRSVIVTDDGIATGSTMLAALHVLRTANPREIILAVPVAPPETLERFRPLCNHIVCVLTPQHFYAIGQFYRDFEQVEDAEVVRLLRDSRPMPERQDAGVHQ